MGDAFIVRKGGKSVERTTNPSINFISATTTSLTVTFTNNDSGQVDLYYGIEENPPTTKITLDPEETSSNITFTLLNNTTEYEIFAFSIVTDPVSKKIKSEITSSNLKTLIPAPTISFTSINFFDVSFTVTNNSNENATIIYDLITPPVENILQINNNSTSSIQTFENLDDNTTYTIFAQAFVDGFVDSIISSFNFTTPEFKLFSTATGGTTLEYNQGGKRWRSHTFTSGGSFVVTEVGNGDRNLADYLIIAGGGGGGSPSSAPAGAGGAGGYRTTVGTSGAGSAAESKITLSETTYNVIVGGGGAGRPRSNSVNPGGNGGTSSVFGIASTGGGGGGSAWGNGQGRNGGSGGGMGGQDNWDNCNADTRGLGTANQGRNGGNGQGGAGQNWGRRRGGGGGGSSGQGGNGCPLARPNGGAGTANLIRTGANQTRAGGGGGGSGSGAAGAGAAGGGNGGSNNVSGSSAGANTGSGGGAGGGDIDGRPNSSGSGGSGIVIIRYEIEPN